WPLLLSPAFSSYSPDPCANPSSPTRRASVQSSPVNVQNPLASVTVDTSPPLRPGVPSLSIKIVTPAHGLSSPPTPALPSLPLTTSYLCPAEPHFLNYPKSRLSRFTPHLPVVG